MLPILLCQPLMSEMYAGGMAVDTDVPLHFVTMQQMAAQGQSDRMASDMEVHVKQRCRIEFLPGKKMTPIDIH